VDGEQRSSRVLGRARDVLGQGTRLLLRLHWSRLKLFCWPHAVGAPRRLTLNVAERYFCLCLALTGLLEHRES
jgi:hypothetical protein